MYPEVRLSSRWREFPRKVAQPAAAAKSRQNSSLQQAVSDARPVVYTESYRLEVAE
jgi:hypothetical protein